MKDLFGIEEGIEELADFIDAVATVGGYLMDADDSNHSNHSINRKEHERELIAAGGWQCKCGQVNASYVGSCQCGGTKQKNSVPYEYKKITGTEPERPVPTKGWVCLCGKKNFNYNTYCSCGGLQADGKPYGDGQPSGQTVTEPREEVNEPQEPVKIVLPQSTKPQKKPIQERTNKRFDNPFHKEEKEWKCSRCGAIKPSFVPICECGMSKRDNG